MNLCLLRILQVLGSFVYWLHVFPRLKIICNKEKQIKLSFQHRLKDKWTTWSRCSSFQEFKLTILCSSYFVINICFHRSAFICGWIFRKKYTWWLTYWRIWSSKNICYWNVIYMTSLICSIRQLLGVRIANPKNVRIKFLRSRWLSKST